MGLRRLLVPAVVVVVVATLVLGITTGLLGSLARSGLEATRLSSGLGASTISPGALDPSVRGSGSASPSASATAPTDPDPTDPAPTDPDLPAPVLAAAATGHLADAAAVAAKVRGVEVKDSGGYSGSVIDVGTGKVLFARDARQAYIPASTMKLLTSAAVLSVYGPEHRFTTSVVSPKAGQIVLVGGGDPYLQKSASTDEPTRASLSALARSTAKALKADGVKKVGLGYDASLFTGPAWNPTWPDGYADVVSPVSALWFNEGRTIAGGGVTGPRVTNSPKVAADAFADALEKQGIDVGTVAAARAPKSAAPVAKVASMTLDNIVEHVLMTSDNDGAEVLLRQAAIGAGRSGSFADGLATVKAQLTKLGTWDSSTSLHDGSGLSRQTKVPADTMAKVLRVAAQDKHPELRPVITGLPVAGVEGSLTNRFGDDQSLAGRGLVRGKTGTLRKVHALAGVVRTRDGSLLTYAFLVNNPKNDYNATVWLQRVTAALSTCGC